MFILMSKYHKHSVRLILSLLPESGKMEDSWVLIILSFIQLIGGKFPVEYTASVLLLWEILGKESFQEEEH